MIEPSLEELDTVLGRVRLRRAYYHCAVCAGGIVPRDDGLGVAGRSLSPGLRRMLARAAAVEPFAGAADLLADLAGIRLSTKRVERSAEADARPPPSSWSSSPGRCWAAA